MGPGVTEASAGWRERVQRHGHERPCRRGKRANLQRDENADETGATFSPEPIEDSGGKERPEEDHRVAKKRRGRQHL